MPVSKERRVEIFRRDPRIHSLEVAAQFLESQPKFTQGPWIYIFSSTSLNKQRVALSPRALKAGLIPVVPADPEEAALFRVPELDPHTGYVDNTDMFAVALRKLLYPESANFASLTAEDQARLQSFLKVIYNADILMSFCSFVVAGDVRGSASGYHLTQTQDIETQRQALNLIAKARIIEGAVAVSAGEITVDWQIDPTCRMPDWKAIPHPRDVRAVKTESRRLLVHVNGNRLHRLCDDYIAFGQSEIRKSAWVLNALGPVSLGMNLIDRIEVEDASGQFREMPFWYAQQYISGYPIDLLTELLKERFPGGNYHDQQDQRHIINFARHRIEALLEYLQKKKPDIYSPVSMTVADI